MRPAIKFDDIRKVFAKNFYVYDYKKDGRAAVIGAPTHEDRKRVHEAAAKFGFESVRHCRRMVPKYVGKIFNCKVCGHMEKWDDKSKKYVSITSSSVCYSSQEDSDEICDKCPRPYVAIPDSVLVWPRGIDIHLSPCDRKRYQAHNRYHATATALLCMQACGLPRDVAYMIMKEAGFICKRKGK